MVESGSEEEQLVRGNFLKSFVTGESSDLVSRIWQCLSLTRYLGGDAEWDCRMRRKRRIQEGMLILKITFDFEG